MSNKVFISRIIPNIGLDLLRDANFEVDQWKDETKIISKEELIERCQHVDALYSIGTVPLDKEFFNRCSHLKIVALMSVGYDHVDIEAATQHGIPVTNTPGVLSKATADTAFLLMLASSRKAFYHHKKILEGKWKSGISFDNLGIELHNKTLGIFGLGRIGVEMAKLCKGAYNMNIIYHNRNRNIGAEKALDAEYVSFEDLLKRSDVVSAHTGLTPETEGKFNIDAFSKMKKNAIFINTARGGVHNEADLIKALQEGMIWGAGLDVTNPEPMKKDNPLLDMPNVAVLPHIGSATVETRDEMAKLAAENIIAFFNGKPLLTCVNEGLFETS